MADIHPSTNEIALPATGAHPTIRRDRLESDRSRLAARHPDRLGPNSRPVTHRKSTSARGHNSSRHPDIPGHNAIRLSQNNQTDQVKCEKLNDRNRDRLVEGTRTGKVTVPHRFTVDSAHKRDYASFFGHTSAACQTDPPSTTMTSSQRRTPSMRALYRTGLAGQGGP